MACHPADNSLHSHDNDGREQGDKIDPVLDLQPHEYVVARINIPKTLISVYYSHATYHHTPGTFARDSREDMARVVAW
jgi:hypothetical protein